MKQILRHVVMISSVGAAILGAAGLARGQGNTTWTGAGADLNWSTAANWSTAGGSTPPATVDNAIFSNNPFPASTNVNAAVNNIVSASTTVAGLSYLNVSPNTHTTLIPAGQTLTVNGTVTVGVASSTTVVNMVGTGNFIVNNLAGNFNVGGNGGSTEVVTFTLADGTNAITASKLSLGESGSNNGRQCIINLGAGTNLFYFDTINMGTGKGLGNIVWLAATTTGGLTIRDHTGNGRATLLLGNGTSGSGGSRGNLLMTGHRADILASTMTLGRVGNDTANQIGVNSFDNGIEDITSILMGVVPATGVPSGNGASTLNILNVGGNPTNTALLIVNSPTGPGGGSFIVSDSVNTSAHVASATVNILQNGVAQVYTSMVKAQAALNTATISLVGGSLNMEAATNTIGTPSAPIDNFSMDGATFQFAENGSAVNASVVNLTVAETNVFTIGSLPIISSLPTVIPVITYTTIGMDGNPSNLVLNPLPGSYHGYLTNDGVSSISLVITSGPIFTKADQWGGNVNNSWDTTSLNWTNVGVSVKYADGDFVTFDDTGKTNNVTISGTRIPGSLTVNNNTLNYTFSGNGAISGSSALVKNGAASLTLSETGGDNFAGGIYVHGGTLILDNPGSVLNGGLTNDPGTVVQIGNGDNTGVLPGGIVQDNGTLVFNRTNNQTVASIISGSGSVVKSGTNTLTLTGANTYTGNTTVTGGTLALNGTGTEVSTLTTVRNSTLDTTLANFVVFNTLALTNGTLVVGAGTNSPQTSILNLTNSTISLTANYQNVGASAVLSAAALNTGGATNVINVTAIQNLPLSPTLPFSIPLIAYISATFNGGFNFGWTNLTGITGYITNNAVNSTIDLVVTTAPLTLTWNGGSASGNNWSDAANWSGVPIAALDALTFDGIVRTNPVNDTAVGTQYAGVTFAGSAGSFALNGNAINLTGIMVNNSPNVQTVNLGLLLNGACTLDGGQSGGSLLFNGGITNITGGGQTVTLLDSGTIGNLVATNNGASGGGQVQYQMGNSSGEWAVVDSTGGSTLIQAGNFQLNNNSGSGGIMDYGTVTSAPSMDAGTNGSLSVNGANCTFNMNNGFLKVNSMTVANNGTAIDNFNMNGGTLVLGPGAFTSGGGNGASVFNGVITNGAIYSTNGGVFMLTQRSLGTFMVNGGILQCGALNLTTGTAAGANGTFDLNGGRLIVTNISVGSAAANGWGLLNYNGGVLQLGASSTALFKQNNLVPLTNIVQLGGAVIDTAGFSSAFNFPLLTDPNLGGTPDGGLVKLGAGTLTLSGASTYIGDTVVSNGTLAVNGSLGLTIVRVAAGTLAGTGSVGSNVTVNAGAAISPAGAGALGTLTIAGDLALQGTTALELSKATATNDLLAVTGKITYGGTLAVTNLAGSLTASDTFKLFNGTTYTGSFTTVVPAVPAPGLAWNTSTLATDGILRFTATVNTTPTNITTMVVGNTLTLSWPADHIGWHLQVQTNSLSTGLRGNWTDVSGSSSVNSVNITINPANGTVFYRMAYP